MEGAHRKGLNRNPSQNSGVVVVFQHFVLKSKAVISENDLRTVKSINFQACLRFLIPQMWKATCLRFAVFPLWWMDLMSDLSLPALPVSNVSFHASRLPTDWSLWSRCDCLFLRFGFKRRQAFRGCTCICSSTSSSSSHSLPLCSPFQVFPGVSESLSSLLFLSSRDRWEQTAWQFSLFFSLLLTFFFSTWGCSLCISLSRSFYFSPNWVERKPWSTILKEQRQLWCIFNQQTEPCEFGPTADILHKHPD